MFKQTALTSVDSYKISHADQFPEGMTLGYSNFTPRNLDYLNADFPNEFKTDSIVWFGLQGFMQELKSIWQETFFDIPWPKLKKEIEEFYAPFSGPNGFNTNRMAALYDLGYLPIQIKALPEGSLVPKGVPVLTIVNTHPEFFWLPNFLETWISAELWKGCTTATTAFTYRKVLDKHFKKTGACIAVIDFFSHDFSLRGMSGIVDGAKSGAGHLLSSLGTDNFAAVKYANDCYRGKETFVGCSVPASEHSVSCCGGKETELETYRRLIANYPSGIISLVSDTWSLWNVISGPESIAAQLKQEILARTPDSLGIAKVVFRPDSGDPVDIICGWDIEEIDPHGKYCETLESAKSWATDSLAEKYDNETEFAEMGDCDQEAIFKWKNKYYLAKAYIEVNRHDKTYYYRDGVHLNSFEEIQLTPEQKGSVESLWEIFGGTTNELGYKTLNQRVGLIYGDSITVDRMNQILTRLSKKGFAADNCVFGVGSYTYNMKSRDSLGFAMKMTYAEINGQATPIFKDPITDNGTKKSAKGLLSVEKVDGKFVLINEATKEQEASGELKTVFLNGEILVNESFETLRNRLKEYV